MRLRERNGLDVLRAGTLGALALLTLVAIAGCASAPAGAAAPVASGSASPAAPSVAAAPIPDVGAIVGRWAGTATPGDQPFSLTINPGGTLVATWDGEARWGTVTVREGEATYEMQPGGYEGTIHLFEGEGGRRIVLQDASTALHAQGVPVRVASR